MDITFLIVNYNMTKLVESVVASLDAHLAGSDRHYEILVCDNSTNPEDRAAVAKLRGSVAAVVDVRPGAGYVAALNSLMPMARGRFVCLMHPDVELKSGCMDRLVAFLEEHPSAGIVAPDLYYPDGHPNKIRLRMPAIRTEGRRLVNLFSRPLLRRNLVADEVVWDRSADALTETIMSVCMLIRADALRAIGSIDPSLFTYYANDYISYRVRQLGWTCHYIRSAVAIHYERYTPPELFSQRADMAYKTDPIVANPRMRADYYRFVSLAYPASQARAFKVIGAAEDLCQVFLKCLRPWRVNRVHVRQLLASVLVAIRSGIRRRDGGRSDPGNRPRPS